VPSTILLADDVTVDPRAFGPLVAAALGVSVTAARMAVRRGRGIFLENVDDAHAERLVAELRKAGIEARAFPTSALPPLPAVVKALQLDHGEELLSYSPAGGSEVELLPWEAIGTVSVGAVADPKHVDLFGHVEFRLVPPLHKLEGAERELVRENLLLKMSNAPSPARARRKPDSIFDEIERKWGRKVHVYADVLTEDLGTWLRVPMDEVAYRFQAGSIRQGGPWGMQALVNDLRDRAPSALSGMTLKLLDAADIKGLVFGQTEEFTRYTAWCALRRQVWPTADSSSRSPEPPGPPTADGSSSASSAPEPPSTSS
jgi:hypothetical protein